MLLRKSLERKYLLYLLKKIHVQVDLHTVQTYVVEGSAVFVKIHLTFMGIHNTQECMNS